MRCLKTGKTSFYASNLRAARARFGESCFCWYVLNIVPVTVAWLTKATQISVDCLFALLALDYHHGCQYGREDDDENATGAAMRTHTSEAKSTVGPPSAATTFYDGKVRRRCSSASATNETMPPIRSPMHHTGNSVSGPPQTHHPLLSSRLEPREKFILQTAYDVLVMGILVIHVVDFFTSFPSNLRVCKHSSREPLADNDPLHAKLTIKQRCERINIDMHVSGGFDMVVSLVLLGLHFWHFTYRIYEVNVGLPREIGHGKQEQMETLGMRSMSKVFPIPCPWHTLYCKARALSAPFWTGRDRL